MSAFSRDISAPFQHLSAAVSSSEVVDEEFERQFASIKYSFGKINLYDKQEFIQSKYQGPTCESNWVIKDKLLVGAFPGHVNDKQNEETLTTILNCGVSTFVSLQKEYNNENPVENWKNNIGLRPYFKDAEKMIQEKELYPNLHTSVEELSFIHEPIRDCDIIEDKKTINIAKRLVKAIYDGEVVYLHCWGGHGRAGVITCIILHLMYELSSDEAIYLCQKLHDFRVETCQVSSPQTYIQRLQVARIIQSLHINKVLREFEEEFVESLEK
jgi:protein-tyrosine phosphatase